MKDAQQQSNDEFFYPKIIESKAANFNNSIDRN